jgi:hypothetical protein
VKDLIVLTETQGIQITLLIVVRYLKCFPSELGSVKLKILIICLIGCVGLESSEVEKDASFLIMISCRGLRLSSLILRGIRFFVTITLINW